MDDQIKKFSHIHHKPWMKFWKPRKYEMNLPQEFNHEQNLDQKFISIKKAIRVRWFLNFLKIHFRIQISNFYRHLAQIWKSNCVRDLVLFQ